jgi:hypothetical protein
MSNGREQEILELLAKPVKIFSSNVPISIGHSYMCKEIKKLLEDSCNFYELSQAHLTFYLSFELITGVRTDVWYDTGGVRIPCFSGVYILETEENSSLMVGDVYNLLAPGDLYLWEAGKRLRYSHKNTNMLGFSVVPEYMLKNQDLGRWSKI